MIGFNVLCSFRMDTVDTNDISLDRSQTLNVSLNMSSLGKKTGPTLGTVLPIGLCPVQPSTVSIRSIRSQNLS